MKKAVAFFVLAVIGLLLLWLVHQRNGRHRAQEQRDAAYQQQLDRFQHDVLGMHREEVKSYLDSKKISYVRINSNLAVKTGEDPGDEWYCDRWYVYVEFRFSRLKGQTEPLPLDDLDNISVQKIGRCL